jgi:uncharacterized protein involved in exopolysaccharide biosynthesis/Mrp family chromosome partitioning ATPase
VYQRTVEKIGADRILYDQPAPQATGAPQQASWIEKAKNSIQALSDNLSALLTSLHISDPGTPEEMAIRKLENKVVASAPKESTVITVSYSAASPALAQEVVKTLTNVFLDEYVRVNHSEDSQQFFTEQSEKLQKQLADAQHQLRDKKNDFEVSSIESRRAILAKQLEDVQLQMLDVGRSLASSEAEIADLTRAISELQPELVTNRVNGFTNPAKDAMREKLYELEIEESKLRSRYSDSHPLLAQIQKQRKEAEDILKSVPDERTQTTAALNPNQRTLELALIQAKAQREALVARSKTAATQHDELTRQLQALNGQELQISDLERTVQILDGTYRMHVDKLEPARINDALGRERISNIKIAQPATFVGKPTSPKKTLLLACGLMFATCGAIGLALVSESCDQTLRTTDQVERELGLPVLLSFPYRRYASPRGISMARAKRRRRTPGGFADGLDARYRILAREFMSRGGERTAATAVGVIGCDATTARSRVASELAIQAADCDIAPILLIDADDRRRNVTRTFGLNGSPGWREVVKGAAEVQACIHPAEGRRLAVMTPGEPNRGGEHEEVAAGVESRLDQLKGAYGLVIIDLPPAAELNSPPTSGWIDETVLVVEAERTRIQSAQRTKLLLERAGVHVAGVVLANRREHIPRWLYDRL